MLCEVGTGGTKTKAGYFDWCADTVWSMVTCEYSGDPLSTADVN